MIVTPWKALTCADDSHEWEGHTGPTDAWETIAERGLFDYRMCLRCQISQRRYRVPESPGGRCPTDCRGTGTVEGTRKGFALSSHDSIEDLLLCDP